MDLEIFLCHSHEHTTGHLTTVGNAVHLPCCHSSYHHTVIGTTTMTVPCWCHHCTTITYSGFPPLHVTRMVWCDSDDNNLDNNGLCYHCMMAMCPGPYHHHNTTATTKITTFWLCPPPHPWALLLWTLHFLPHYIFFLFDLVIFPFQTAPMEHFTSKHSFPFPCCAWLTYIDSSNKPFPYL